MTEETAPQEEQTEAAPSNDNGQNRTWYPYITRAQFEKFLSRLENGIPEIIDRDYVRGIIRTPSMIHRFLRGIEAMQLIDRDQKPTERLQSLVERTSRQEAVCEILDDLYSPLIQQRRDNDGSLEDSDIVSFFRNNTGMGNDAANKMKVFFKFLVDESETPAKAEAPEAPKADKPAPAPEAEKAEAEAEAEAEKPEKPEPAPRRESSQRNSDQRGQRGQRGGDRSDRSDRNNERSGDRSDRSDRSDRGDRGGSQGSGSVQSDRGSDRGGSQRPLSDVQRAYLETLQHVLKVNIDGDWDDDMIRLTFDRLERLFDRVKRG